MTAVVGRRTVRAVSTAAHDRARPSGDAARSAPAGGDPRHDPIAGLPAFGLGLPPAVRLVGPAVLVALFQVAASFGAANGQPEARSLDAGAIALLLVGPAALLARRRFPALALIVTFAATSTYVFADYPLGPVFLSLLLTVVNAVLRGRRAITWAVLGAAWVAFAWIHPALEDGPWPDWGVVGGLTAWLLVLGAGSELARGRVDRAAENARVRAEQARRRASEERLRIARELHDVLAHDISLISVRAGVALHLVDERPDDVDAEQVRSALAAIKDASKDALGELRSVLDVLRHGEEGRAPLAPTAGLADLDALAERARGTGLDVRVERVNGNGAALSSDDLVDGLPAGADLAAFRIAQEALTNVVRHADARRAVVRLRRTNDELEVRVDDDGTGAGGRGAERDARAGDGTTGRTAGRDVERGAPASAGDATDDDAGGRGIPGMRERASALGGTLEAAPRPGRGFRVRARFPLRGEQ
jgi:signal transduction histidine kinase